jgi:membrane protein YqaA with SNARE-associated domain
MIPEDDEHEELKSNLRKTAWAILILFVGVAAAGYFFENELAALTRWVERQTGLGGLVLLMFLNDTFVSPLPPDLVLLVFSRSAKFEELEYAITLFGIASACAGVVGWWIGTRLRHTQFPKKIFGDRLEAGERFVRKYGPLAVAVGAFTPIPYSLTTWTSGMLGLRFQQVLIPCLLRIPRFWLYYWIITRATSISDWLNL